MPLPTRSVSLLMSRHVSARGTSVARRLLLAQTDVLKEIVRDKRLFSKKSLVRCSNPALRNDFQRSEMEFNKEWKMLLPSSRLSSLSSLLVPFLVVVSPHALPPVSLVKYFFPSFFLSFAHMPTAALHHFKAGVFIHPGRDFDAEVAGCCRALACTRIGCKTSVHFTCNHTQLHLSLTAPHSLWSCANRHASFIRAGCE
jgi:hypothetical protein